MLVVCLLISLNSSKKYLFVYTGQSLNLTRKEIIMRIELPDTDSTVDNELQKISNYTNPGKFNNFTQYRIKYNWVPILCDSLVWMDGWMDVCSYVFTAGEEETRREGVGWFRI